MQMFSDKHLNKE